MIKTFNRLRAQQAKNLKAQASIDGEKNLGDRKKVTPVTGNKKDKQNNKEKEKERTKKTEQI